MQSIIGRQLEIAQLQEIHSSKEAEFLAVYGRRRVGKTFLIREFFQSKGFYLEFTGAKDGGKKHQLALFTEQLSKIFSPQFPLKPPATWHDALNLLSTALEKQALKKQKIILFFDELPWMATKKSGLIQAIDYFWNTQWSQWKNFKFIVCGSAASWMLDHLINAKGGLYNRLTRSLLLRPFSLSQTQQFLLHHKIILKPKQILDLYLMMGGVPHYLKQIKKSLSVIQNIEKICFRVDGLLFNEFPRLYASLFDNPELSMRIMRAIAKKHYGISKEELVRQIGKKSGGTFDKHLRELETSGFIQRFIPYGHKARNQFFRIIDPYSLFYLSWIADFAEQRFMTPTQSTYWSTMSQTPAWYSWAGLAFENICFLHIDNILSALDLHHIPCKIGSWQLIGKKKEIQGAQIDLLFDRADDTITLCEIKYSHQPFIIDKAYAKTLAQKIAVFEQNFNTPKHVRCALITTFGLKPNIWSEDLVDQVITLEDLLGGLYIMHP
jgi:AAA+ ATPase superfamily predicted ATPase